ncbi:hypothetical protein ACVR05_00130 [Streptococcus caprae]|uniref:Uncharacterized protein n=1 Tax=Streptococcus caprae TaxID=1640501 RepID=A0ABV8CYA6_9STRE
MIRNERPFPLVADGETVIEEARIMRLYENEDLITNIKGNYQEKDYDDVTRDYQFISGGRHSVHANPERYQTREEGKSYAELAREEARRDIKKKRQAMPIKEHVLTSKRREVKPTAPLIQKKVGDLQAYAQNLHQEDYILAEIKSSYSQPQNPSTKAFKKNNYDYLKRSQIYNKEAYSKKNQQQPAQELNLSRFDEVE